MKQNSLLLALVKREYFSCSRQVLYTSTEKNFDTEWGRMFAKISAFKEMGKKLNFSLNQHYILLSTHKK